MDSFKETRRNQLQTAIAAVQEEIQQKELAGKPTGLLQLLLRLLGFTKPPDTTAEQQLIRDLQAAAQRLEAIPGSEAELEARILTRLQAIETPEELLRTVERDPLVAATGTLPINATNAPRVLRAIKEAESFADLQRAEIASDDVLGSLVAVGVEPLDSSDLVPVTPDLEVDPGIVLPIDDPAETPLSPSVENDIGVLIGMQIETRFDRPPDAPKAQPWRMRVRIYPDEPMMVRHNPNVTSLELESLTALWEQLLDLGGVSRQPRSIRDMCADALDTDEGRVAWSMLCNRFEPSRAAWLVQTIMPAVDLRRGVVIESDAPVSDELAPNRIVGLPAELELWAKVNGDWHHLATSQPPAGDIEIALPDDPDENPWWASWRMALDLGLAFDIKLSFDPAEIDVLCVVGLGDAEPESLFSQKVWAGELAVLEPGIPTNTIHGEPAADLAGDPEVWRSLAIKMLRGEQAKQASNTAGPQISAALTGNAASFGLIPGHEIDIRTSAHAMVKALYPALWGHYFKDIWGFGEDAHDLGMWVARYLFPEGPYPPIRIAEQPYGILPATALQRWVPAKTIRTSQAIGDPPVEAMMLPRLVLLRDGLAAAARNTGNIVGADTEKLLAFIGQVPSSARYRHRVFLSPHLVQYYLHDLIEGFDPPEPLIDTLRANMTILDTLQREPNRLYMTLGFGISLKLPLVMPEGFTEEMMPQFLQQLAALTALNNIKIHQLARQFFELDPDPIPLQPQLVFNSLLARLAIYSLTLSGADAARSIRIDNIDPDPGPVLEPLVAPSNSLTYIDEWADKWTDGVFPDPSRWTPAERTHRAVREGLEDMADMPLPTMERVMRATLDTAAYRVDPWITGIANRRLTALLKEDTTQFRLGVYGWVDRPMLGAPGPDTEAGLLHAPSDAQALAAIILRDRYCATQSGPDGDLWQMDLRSDLIQIAERIAAAVGEGEHVWQVIGREVEHIIGDWDKIRRLRLNFPIYEDEPDANAVCHGLEALDSLLSGGDLRVRDPSDYVDEEQIALLHELDSAINVYADLLVAESVYHVVQGRAEVAGAVMDAAAGYQQPPNLEVIRTPRQGRSVNTGVMVALQPVTLPRATAKTSPAMIADAAVGNFIADYLGPADEWVWLISSSKDHAAAQSVTLADLDLLPIDTVNLSTEELCRVVLHGQPQSVHIIHRENDGTARQHRAKATIQAFGGQPVLVRDVVPADESETAAAATAELDRAIRRDFCARYERLRETAGLLLEQLRAEAEVLIDDSLTELQRQLLAGALSEGDYQQKVGDLLGSKPELLTASLKWGITPLLGDDLSWDMRIEHALNGLEARVAQSISFSKNTLGGVDIAELMMESDLTTREIASAIAELAAPEGHLAVLSRVEAEPLRDRLALKGIDANLDAEWLTVNAPVRSALAHLESWLLDAALSGDGAAPLQGWTNRPGDCWQTVVEEDDGVILPSRLNVVYSSENTWTGRDVSQTGSVAIVMLDSWGETIPSTEHQTTAAFGFNAPATRPPQAVLIAVPPKLDVPLDTETLIDILDETRELAHARMSKYASDFGGIIPTMMLRHTGLLDAELEPYEVGEG